MGGSSVKINGCDLFLHFFIPLFAKMSISLPKFIPILSGDKKNNLKFIPNSDRVSRRSLGIAFIPLSHVNLDCILVTFFINNL
jgi:hypothetical protein